MNPLRRTAYFGGTFDPVHPGHIGLAQAMVARGYSDRVWFAPAFVPPHKRAHRITSYVHRLNMLMLALRGKPHLESTDFEARIGLNPSYTYDVMLRLRAAYPEEQWQLLIGADSLLELRGWHRAEELVRDFEILTAPRPGIEVTEAALDQAWGEETGSRLYHSQMDLPGFDCSSTKIRKNFAGQVVLPEIQSYIEMCGLYGVSNRRREEKLENRALQIAEAAAKAADAKFGLDIMVLEVGKLTSVADYFVLCTANSGPHLRALSSEIEERLRKDLNVRPLRIDGDVESAWITMDYASVLVHVMTPENRQKYQLESLWSDAPQIDAVKSAIDHMPLPKPAR